MSSSGSYKLQFELSENKLLVEENGIVLDQNSGYQCIIDGALVDAVKGQEFSISINIQDGKRFLVGEIINQELFLLSNITFPDDTQETPKSAKKTLLLSIESGSTNPTGTFATVGKIGGYSSYAACDVINQNDSGLLDNFQLELISFDCGATVYNTTFPNDYYLKYKDKFRLAHVGAAGSGMAIGSMKSFQQLNLTFPIVSASNGDVSLSSTANFPIYMRVSVSNAYAYTLIPIL